MGTVTRADVVDKICKEVGLSRKDSSDILDNVLDEVIKELVAGNDVKLSSFGTFGVKSKNQRIGRNPKTGVQAIISSRKVISFKPSQNMRGTINA